MHQDFFHLIAAELPASDLYSFALVCRYARNAALPHIYKNIKWKDHPPSEKTTLLLRSLSANRELADKVHCLDLEVLELRPYQALFELCKLRSFTYNYLCDLDFTPRNHSCRIMKADDLDDMLQLIKHTLQDLTLRVDFFTRHYDPVIGALPGRFGLEGTLTNLHELSKLVSLEISIALLIGWPLPDISFTSAHLPPLLRHFTARGDLWDVSMNDYSSSDIVSVVEVFLDAKTKSMRDLEKITLKLSGCKLGDDFEEEDQQTLEVECAAAGVEFEVLETW